ncbi:TetR/AcrR family transcriptional regulator C-terminal domain-containing protein [Leucobacter sp. M11]|uniref:TetR/AcrR family transcriptional regulator C-terminal domain-containing protein n=1 Tax=Leucobacter sp. M11 TaxID=2993565 RepID=UPI002D7EFC32|nr:TetR/AcrR family transcriptional regulator C-terminal domain-containing protein [Leucobacter sp. M11]MEB4616118.1 TetR/AcrR family transcriptional regulator C-terminal domain-containing protein [Leucobacter sp. M11]
MRLNRREIARAALELVEEHGSEALTMRQLAARVDRQPSSLYNHVSGRQAVIEEMRALIVESIDVTPFAEQPWPRALADWGRSYLASFARYPNSISLLATTTITDHSTLRMYEVVISALVRGGWTAGDAVAGMRAVEAYVLGSALDRVAPESLLSLEALPPGLPALREGLTGANARHASAAAGFELGYEILIAGMEARVTAAL